MIGMKEVKKEEHLALGINVGGLNTFLQVILESFKEGTRRLFDGIGYVKVLKDFNKLISFNVGSEHRLHFVRNVFAGIGPKGILFRPLIVVNKEAFIGGS